jgi:hypothetical protein
MNRIHTCCVGLCLLLLLPALEGKALASQRLRLLIETDLGGDPDDEQSLVRFLLYANEWDVEGIICNRPRARDRENLNPERTGLGIARRLLDAYGLCHPNLIKHDRRYPTKEALWKRTVAGYEDKEDGVKLLIAAVDRDDPRPLWYSDWGSDKGSSTNNLKRALDRVLKERGPKGYTRFKDRLRLSSADKFGEHTSKRSPPFRLWVDTYRPEREGKRWYHRFSALTARAGGFDLKRDVLTNHGPLGALYPTNTTHPQKEGDTMTFLYLVPTGMNNPDQPTWGSWAGRYGRQEINRDRPYYWANQQDTWQGTTNRDNTLKRWAVHLQNDFRARLDWCVKDVSRANHPPEPKVRGKLQREVATGDRVTLDARDSTDPDKQTLTYSWVYYPEPGNYRGPAPEIENANRALASFIAPKTDSPQTLHLLLIVTDNGSPPLTRYRRVIVTVRPPSRQQPPMRLGITRAAFEDRKRPAAPAVFPGKVWAVKKPDAVGLDAGKLACFSRTVGGRGCIVRHGYLAGTWGDASRSGDVASAAKPVYAHFLWKALAQKKVSGLDEAVVKYRPGLNDLNKALGFKDRGITWRHLVTQSSCYGVSEAPGKAFDYSDYQMALFWDLLFGKVYRAAPEKVDAAVLHPEFVSVLGCQDWVSMLAFGGKDRPGRLAISPRDFARFGLLYLREGRWNGKQVLPAALVRQAIGAPLSNAVPRTADKKAEMLRGQRTIGGGNNQTDHLGSYSYLWWTNGVDRQGSRHWPDLPVDAYAALGHGGKRGLLIVPSLDLVVSWNDAQIEGRESENHLLRLVVAAVSGSSR